jgi:twinkle protein
MIGWKQLNIDVGGYTHGQVKTICPKCSHKRRNSRDRCLSVNLDEGIWLCHHCAWSGTLKKKEGTNRMYIIPKLNDTELSDAVFNFFKGRGISKDTIKRNKITEDVQFMPSANKDIRVMCFNYFRDGEIVNVKYRDANKGFKMVHGAEPIFYKLDDIKESNTIIITEGELDALSFEEAGFKNAVSVPNGASKGRNNLIYLDNCYEHFEGEDKLYYLATDNDEAGVSLRNELARRFGIERCRIVGYPDDCKDANEVLMKHGAEKLKECYDNAKPFPIEGIIIAEDIYPDVVSLYNKGIDKGVPIGYKNFDELVSFKQSLLYIYTGVPGMGKSSFVNQVELKLAARNKWKFGIFSPENYPFEYLIYKYAELYVGKPFFKGRTERISEMELEDAVKFINNHFYFIRPKDEVFSMEEILNRAKALILQYGINCLTIDPWNTIDHDFGMFNEHQYIERMLTKLTIFKQMHNIAIFLVAHPRKIQKIKDKNSELVGLYEVPTLYDISGSSNFFNKADFGITIYRNFVAERIEVYVQKAKYKNLGQLGTCDFHYNIVNGRFNEVADSLDNKVEAPEPRQAELELKDKGYPIEWDD